MIYFIMSVAYFLCTVAWGMVLRANRDSPQLFRVHYLMLALMASKTLSLLLRGIDYHYIKTTGHENKEWAALFYMVCSTLWVRSVKHLSGQLFCVHRALRT